MTDIYYLFRKERHINFGNESINHQSIIEMANESKDFMRVKFEFFENNYIIAFCTPKMLGSLSQFILSSRVMCIDSSGKSLNRN